ncbi:MAG TPA: hypothetical protein VNX29_04405 [Kaistia sp.]|nr:hypothetical protein [Kaistia sp.]
MRGRRSKSFKWRVSEAVLEEVARAVWDLHADWIARGLRLMSSSGVWRCNDGTHTVRLVYRSDDRAQAMTVCIRKLRFAE